MKLSIITINYNNAAGLKRTADSIVNQVFTDYEWLVIDGGSTDGSMDIIEQFGSYISYYVSEPDRGIYHAMNKGIAVAKGEYCQFLNSGDYFIDGSTLQRVFDDNSLLDVNYGDQWCSSEGVVSEKRTYPDQMTLSYLFRAPLGHQASFFKTEVIKKHLYKEAYTISADRAFFMELYCFGYKFHHIQQPIVYFDTQGIGSNLKTLKERQRQLALIKREFFSDQVVRDIEDLLYKESEYDFVMRVAPLRFFYLFLKKLQALKNKLF